MLLRETDPGVVKEGVFRTTKLRATVNASAASNAEVIDSPLWEYKTDDDAVVAVLPDEDAEIVVTKIVWSASGTGTLSLHNGDGVAFHTITLAVSNEKSEVLNDKALGGGNPLHYTLSSLVGEVEFYVEYYIYRKTWRPKATSYILLDA